MKGLRKIICLSLVAAIFLLSSLPVLASGTDEGISWGVSGPPQIPETIFSDFFPDANLAQCVAGQLGRSAGDAVTEEELAGITHLFADNKGIRDLTGIRYLRGLQFLYLSNNALGYLHEEVGQLTSLLNLFLDNCGLSVLPAFIGNLTQLDYLKLSGNNLYSLPEAIGSLTKLRGFYADNNRLFSLPESIGNWTTVNEMDLHANNLMGLPESFGNLKSLIVLYLHENSLRQLPSSFNNLTGLSILDLSYNSLAYLPNNWPFFNARTFLHHQSDTTYGGISAIEGYIRFQPIVPTTLSDVKASMGITDEWFLERTAYTITRVDTGETTIIDETTGLPDWTIYEPGDFIIEVTTTEKDHEIYGGHYDSYSGHHFIQYVTIGGPTTPGYAISFDGSVRSFTGLYSIEIDGIVYSGLEDGVHILTGQDILDRVDITLTVTDTFSQETAVLTESALTTLHVTVVDGWIQSINLAGQVKVGNSNQDRFSIMFSF